jgi:nicotinamidase-related amidase/type 1 glutamine amidotransferase
MTLTRIVAPLLFLAAGAARADDLTMTARHRVPNPADASGFEVRDKTLKWNPKQTAIVICDMWDKHWCDGATKRVGEMAPRMNAVVNAARAKGVFIVHAPSDCMSFYKDAPQRKLAQQAPKAANLPADISGWCRKIDNEPPLPIDDSDGGCDDVPAARNYRAWTRQHPAIEVTDADAVSDSGVEIWNLMEQRGIKNVIVMGVHTNMCVLGRPFGLRQMAKHGRNVVLARDLTDAMYNPRKAPFVSHRRGTEFVIDHIERYVCGSIHSADITGDAPRPHAVFLIGEDEYQTEQSLPEFAKTQLEPRGVRVTLVKADAKNKNLFPGIEVLADADLLLLSVRRRTPSPEQLKVVRDYLESGRPLVGIRTASHAFALKGKDEGWPLFDSEVLGGDYQGHYDNEPKKGPPTVCHPQDGVAKHPILRGVPESFESVYTLYRNKQLAKGTTPLIWGTFGESRAREHVAWTNTYKGARIFYTSLGGVEDFKNESFARLLTNGVFWAMEQPVPAR